MKIVVCPLFLGVQRHVAAIVAIAADARREEGGAARRLVPRVHRLVAHLLAGGILLLALLSVATYAILTRIDQGFAVFG